MRNAACEARQTSKCPIRVRHFWLTLLCDVFSHVSPHGKKRHKHVASFQQVCTNVLTIWKKNLSTPLSSKKCVEIRLVATCNLQTYYTTCWSNLQQTCGLQDLTTNLQQVCWQLGTDVSSTRCRKPCERILISACWQHVCCKMSTDFLQLERFWLGSWAKGFVAERSCKKHTKYATYINILKNLVWKIIKTKLKNKKLCILELIISAFWCFLVRASGIVRGPFVVEFFFRRSTQNP